MLDYNKIIATELSLQQQQVEQSLELLIEGATVPFIARYRKEKTGSLDETQLRDIWERYTYLSELDKRKDTILEAIKNQDKLTDQLQKKIESCLSKTELEDLYLPYKPKRRTKATIAREKGLEGLATAIKYLNIPDAKLQSLEEIAGEYISEEKGVNNLEEALQGASDILAEEVAEKANLRAYLRDYLMKESIFISSIKKEHPEGSTKYEMYRNFQASVTKIAPHNILALFRGETEKIISLSIDFDETYITAYLYNEEIKTKNKGIKAFYQSMLKDSFNRLIKPSLLREVRADRKNWADLESINTFEINLRELLLSPPAGMQPTLAIDPGFRTGCKVAVLSETGQFLEYQAIFPHTGAAKQKEAKNTLKNLIQKYEIELIAIGNGTASRETDQFVGEVIKPLENQPIKVIVNESGASIYSASDLAREEFPDLDITVRGAISIGRRLQDPLAELVKIDPKSIGVGQYQHDVGVDLNTASKQLLTFVSGITPTIANNIVSYRDKNGIFNNRKELLKVSKLGPKAYEQAAGFLRIRGGKNPLDNTAVHPESYTVVETIIKQLGVSLSDINNISSRLKSLDLNTFVTDTIGLPTLEDVIAELEKPGRDPREEFKYATFNEGVTEISDLSEGMILEGVITNVVKFGAFIDIGVHQDGLIHISQLANYFVNDTNEVVKVGEVVKVKVLEIDEKLKRVSLSMKEV